MSILMNDSFSGKPEASVDLREALFNQGETGPIERIQVSTERIVQVRGILFDLDPDLYHTGRLLPAVPKDPHEFYAAVVRPWLNRHPVLAKAEVRNSGRGLHCILRFQEPVEIKTAGQRAEWIGVVEVVQAALPVDPNQPGITATTRALGSINSKNGAAIQLLAKGEPVTEAEVRTLYSDMVERPFVTVMMIIAGREGVQPCPICAKEGTKLSAGRYSGRCYGCGCVQLEKLYDLVLAPTANGKETKANAKGT